MRLLKSLRFGAKTHKVDADEQSLAAADQLILSKIRPYTMTSALRVEALLKSVRYVVDRNIPGAFVECGVWKGGSVLAMIYQLLDLELDDRDIYLYDTFDGMTEPSELDVEVGTGASAMEAWKDAAAKGKRVWEHAFGEQVFNEDTVKGLLLDTGYPTERLHIIKGPVEETIPLHAAEEIAILRLDTDWYESTLHELEQLYPRVVPGGIVIIDDYGHWEGCRKAVDEYFSRPDIDGILLNRIDYTGRLAVKV